MATAVLPNNKGRLINSINGIQGVAAGGQALANLQVGLRVHRQTYQCTAVNYTAPTVVLIGAGTYNATLTPTVTNGVITAVAITTAGSGMSNATYTSAGGGVQITDATGVGAQLSIVVSGGAVTSVAIVSGGTPGPISPSVMCGVVKQSVNGTIMRDITADQILRIAIANGYVPNFGELPIFYTEPWRKASRAAKITSWDLAGQSSFTTQFQIANGITTPGLAGSIEFDYGRNGPTVNGKFTPVLQPVTQHSYSQQLAVGQNSITTIPITSPILRMWILGATPGAIYQAEIDQDSQKPMESTYVQMAEMYAPYGFQTGDVYQGQNGNGNNGWGGSSGPGNTGVISSTYQQVATSTPNGPLNKAGFIAGNGVFPFDYAYISDPDQSIFNALRVANSLVVKLWSSVAQNCTIVVEALPGKYG